MTSLHQMRPDAARSLPSVSRPQLSLSGPSASNRHRLKSSSPPPPLLSYTEIHVREGEVTLRLGMLGQLAALDLMHSGSIGAGQKRQGSQVIHLRVCERVWERVCECVGERETSASAARSSTCTVTRLTPTNTTLTLDLSLGPTQTPPRWRC